MSGALTLVCAPAGFGKTTLLVDWLGSRASEAQAQVPVAWLSLDESDSDPVQFVRLLVAALRNAIPRIGETVLAMMQSPQPPPLRTPLTALINELVAAEREIVLVFEDYHAIRHTAIHEAMAFLLEHLPPLLHVVIATREDPLLPLAQLRARVAVCEVRAADLRFTTEEAAVFLRDVMGLSVSADEVAALEARTEGWIVGLQLAGLSVSAGDMAGFIAAFEGTDRHILDYLREEVLARQRPAVESFLLRTSILDRLSGPLCDAVLDEAPTGSQLLLEEIERRNLFLIPLDAERHWYRYHHLFADLLRHQLQRTQPTVIPELHRRASAWYEQQGILDPAIRHALAATDFDRAARLVEQHGVLAITRGELRTVLGWFDGFPAGQVRTSPLLGTVYATALVMADELERAEACLRDAERHLSSDAPFAEVAFVRGRIALLRSIMGVATGDFARIVTLATEALRLLPADDVWGRSVAQSFAAHAFRASGDVSIDTERTVVEAARQAKAAGIPALMRVSLGVLGRLYVCQGRLRRAGAQFSEAAQALDARIPLGLPMHAFGYGELLREWNEFDKAEVFLTQGIEALTGTNVFDAHVAAEGYIALARLRQARGDAGGAMGTLDAFAVLAQPRDLGATVVALVAAARAHLWLMQGNLGAARRWADSSGLGLEDPVSFLREREYLTLARVLIARTSRTALALLDRLLQDAEAYGRLGSAIEILVLRARAFQVLGNPAGALQDLGRALALGEPEGYVRVFVDEGAAMATLLRRAYALGIAPEYAIRLLGAFGNRSADPDPSGSAPQGSTIGASARPEAASLLVEQLTGREREILRLIVAGASNQEIAKRLFVAMGTVKAHITHIFNKLGVKSRTQAIAKAKALTLD